jgi:RND family efflux transporter MFP subunit
MKRLIIGLAAICSLTQSCTTNNAAGNDNQARTYPVVALQPRDTIFRWNYVAHIQAAKNVELHSRATGLIEKVLVEEGQHVRKGQLLFKINEEEARLNLERANAALQSARAQLRIAEVELKRVSALVGKNIIPDSERELSEAKHDAAKAQVAEALAAQNEARTFLSYTSVHAPFDGIIDRLPLKQGSLVTKGSLLTTISDLEAMYAYFDVSENEYFRLLQSGEQHADIGKVQLQLADGSLYPLEGVVQPAESEFDESTGSIAFRALFKNPSQILKHGATGMLQFSKPLHDVIMVPQKSVFEIQDKSYVFVLDAGNKVKMKSFTAAQRIGDYFLVASGLREKDQVVYEGVQSLRDGTIITPVPARL